MHEEKTNYHFIYLGGSTWGDYFNLFSLDEIEFEGVYLLKKEPIEKNQDVLKPGYIGIINEENNPDLKIYFRNKKGEVEEKRTGKENGKKILEKLKDKDFSDDKDLMEEIILTCGYNLIANAQESVRFFCEGARRIHIAEKNSVKRVCLNALYYVKETGKLHYNLKEYDVSYEKLEKILLSLFFKRKPSIKELPKKIYAFLERLKVYINSIRKIF